MDLGAGFRLRQWQVQPDQNRLIGNGSDIRLTPRAMEVLVCLSEHAGQVVTRDDFSERVWNPAVVTDNSLTRCISELRRSLGDRTGTPQYIETIPKRGYRLVAPVTPVMPVDENVEDVEDASASASEPLSSQPATRPRRPIRRNSIAVLPFQVIGAETVAPLADGIHHDLLTRLSAVVGLKVISSTSARRYRDTDLAMPEIAAQLGVVWIVEGAVQKVGEYLQVNAQLIDAARDHHLWARTYRQPYSAENLFSIQGEIMEDIATSLEAKLDAGQRLRGEHVSTNDLEAYACYIQGRSFLDTRIEAGMRQALMYFRTALERDHDYALAWVGVADATMLLYDYYDHGSPDKARQEVEKALKRALELDPELAAVHASTGLYHMSHAAAGPLRAEGLDGSAAVRWLKRAVELQPGYAEAYNWLSWVLQLLGQADQALVCANASIELNPLSPETIHNLISSNMVNGHFGRGLREARRIEELGMYDTTPQFYEGIAMYHLGRHDDAARLLRDVHVEWTGAGPLAALALAEIARGKPERADERLPAIEAAGDRFAVGLVHAGLGNVDAAFEHFGRIRQWGQWPALVMHHYYPDVLGPVRADPRFGPLLASLRAYYGLQPDGSLSVALDFTP
ncbi:MAG: winged helix-turn-helix domain-containing protein [Wenzhouxiangellaceae bacterium]